MSALTTNGKLYPVIPKKDLVNSVYYIGRTYQRGMPIGIWNKEKDCFLCVHECGFGMYEVYEMKHIEDDKGTVCFEPVNTIEI